MDHYGQYEDPSHRNYSGDGYKEGAPNSPRVPWRQDIPVRNQYGPLQGYDDNREEDEQYNTGGGTSASSQSRGFDGPPEAAPLRNKTDHFLGRGQGKKRRLREDAEEANGATPKKSRRR